MAKNSLSSVYNDTREEGAKLQKTFFLPIHTVQCTWDENIRPRNDEHTDSWKNTFLKNDYIPPILVEMRNGEPHVIEGFHRHTAQFELDAEGKGNGLIECKEWKGSVGDKLITMRNSTTGLPLTFLEDAEVILRILKEEDLTAEKLASRIGVSRTAVNNKVLVAEAQDEIKELIREEKISATMAIDFIIKHGDKALNHIEHALDKANRKGAAKVTRGSSGPKAFSAAKLRNAVELLAKGLDTEEFVNNLDSYGDGDVDITLTLSKDEVVELVYTIDEYCEHLNG